MKEKDITKESNNASLQNRRDALKKLGKHSVYTAPALMTLLFSAKASALSPPPPPGG